jgi:hypothetical protein
MSCERPCDLFDRPGVLAIEEALGLCGVKQLQNFLKSSLICQVLATFCPQKRRASNGDFLARRCLNLILPRIVYWRTL